MLKMLFQFTGKRMNYLLNKWWQYNRLSMMKKITFDLYVTSPTKINFRWMKDLNVNNKNVKTKNRSKNQGDYI